MKTMSDQRPLDDLIARTRRRAVWNLLLRQAALAVTVTSAGVLVLLIVGTQILNWPWLVFLFLGSLAFGAVRSLRRLPSRYETAQRVDHFLSLKDTISTAFFFRHLAPAKHAPGDVVKARSGARRKSPVELTLRPQCRWRSPGRSTPRDSLSWPRPDCLVCAIC